MADEMMQNETRAVRNEQRDVRLEKLNAMQAAGQDPFKITLADQAQHCSEITADFDAFDGKDVSVCGRMMSKRRKGKVSFIDIRDRDGRIQVYVKFDDVVAIPADTLFMQDRLITASGMGGTTTLSRSEQWSVKFSTNADGSLIMPPVYNPTNVYLVRSADGQSVYKLYFYSYQNDQGVTGHLKFNLTKL